MANIQKERELLTNEMNKFFQSPLSPYIYYCQFSAIQVILGGRCDQIVTGQGKFSQRMVTWKSKILFNCWIYRGLYWNSKDHVKIWFIQTNLNDLNFYHACTGMVSILVVFSTSDPAEQLQVFPSSNLNSRGGQKNQGSAAALELITVNWC